MKEGISTTPRAVPTIADEAMSALINLIEGVQKQLSGNLDDVLARVEQLTLVGEQLEAEMSEASSNEREHLDRAGQSALWACRLLGGLSKSDTGYAQTFEPLLANVVKLDLISYEIAVASRVAASLRSQ